MTLLSRKELFKAGAGLLALVGIGSQVDASELAARLAAEREVDGLPPVDAAPVAPAGSYGEPSGYANTMDGHAVSRPCTTSCSFVSSYNVYDRDIEGYRNADVKPEKRTRVHRGNYAPSSRTRKAQRIAP